MNQSRGPTGRATANVALVEEQDFQAAHRRVARDPGAVDAGADDDYVKLATHHLVSSRTI